MLNGGAAGHLGGVRAARHGTQAQDRSGLSEARQGLIKRQVAALLGGLHHRWGVPGDGRALKWDNCMT